MYALSNQAIKNREVKQMKNVAKLSAILLGGVLGLDLGALWSKTVGVEILIVALATVAVAIGLFDKNPIANQASRFATSTIVGTALCEYTHMSSEAGLMISIIAILVIVEVITVKSIVTNQKGEGKEGFFAKMRKAVKGKFEYSVDDAEFEDYDLDEEQPDPFFHQEETSDEEDHDETASDDRGSDDSEENDPEKDILEIEEEELLDDDDDLEWESDENEDFLGAEPKLIPLSQIGRDRK